MNTWLSPGRHRFNPPSSQDLFLLFSAFPGLSKIFTKKQSWNSRYTDFFRMNIKILTTRVLKKWSELKKVTWKIVQLNLKSNSILLISPKKLHPAQFFHNFERKIGHEIFVKTEKTEYLSNQLTYAHFDRKFIFPIKFGTSEQIFIFLDFQSVSNFWNSYC